MFGKKKKLQVISYDPETQKPVIRCSICNGEQVAGLKNRRTGEFKEIMVIRSSDDLQQFREMVGQDDIPKEY